MRHVHTIISVSILIIIASDVRSGSLNLNSSNPIGAAIDSYNKLNQADNERKRIELQQQNLELERQRLELLRIEQRRQEQLLELEHQRKQAEQKNWGSVGESVGGFSFG